jgi:tRNA-dihydrouridine synthase B
VMRSAAAIVAEAGADLIDINMGCPVKKVCKTGAGAALLTDQDLAVRIADAAREGGGVPVTVKLRSGLRPGGREGYELALRLAAEAGVAAIGFHPRSAATQHKGEPDYALARELAGRIEVPLIISGGLDTAASARHAYEASGADAVMIARGSLGNPWIFEELTGRRSAAPGNGDVVAELLWVMDRAEEHLGPDRAARYLRKFYPWYLERLGTDRATAAALQESDDIEDARRLVEGLSRPLSEVLPIA